MVGDGAGNDENYGYASRGLNPPAPAANELKSNDSPTSLDRTITGGFDCGGNLLNL
jgi:hypothetical protein